MSAFLAVFRRELDEHRLLLRGAVVFGLMPLLLPWLLAPFDAGFARHPIGEARVAIAVGGSVGAAVVLVLLLGSAALARPLADGRLGFFFARPLGTAAIVGGKLAGAYVALLLTLALIWLPTLVVERPALPEGFWLAAGGVLALLFLGLTAVHALSVSALARGPWLLAELVALVVAGLVTWGAHRQLASRWAEIASFLVVGAAIVTAAAILLLAAALALGRGRTDLATVHRRQALLACPLLLVVGVGAAGAAHWYLHPSPSDLLGVAWATSAPIGGRTLIAGPVRGRTEISAQFLFTPGSEPMLFDASADQVISATVTFSPDGRLVAHRRIDRLSARRFRTTLVITELGPAPREVLAVPTAYSESNLAWTSDGSAVLAFDGPHLIAIPPDPRATPRRLLKLPEDRRYPILATTSEGLISLILSVRDDAVPADTRTPIREAWLIDPASGSVLRRGWFPDGVFQLDPTHRRVLCYRPWHPLMRDTTLVIDLDQERERFRIPWRVDRHDALFLPDDRLLVLQEASDGGGNVSSTRVDTPVFAVLFDAAGAELARHVVGTGRAYLLARVDDGRVFFVEQDDDPSAGGRLLTLDLATGRVSTTGVEVERLAHDPIGTSRRTAVVTPSGSLVTVDPTTGELVTLATALPPWRAMPS